jgi:hypothetical protein
MGVHILTKITEYLVANDVVNNLKNEGYLYLTVFFFVVLGSILIANMIAIVLSLFIRLARKCIK